MKKLKIFSAIIWLFILSISFSPYESKAQIRVSVSFQTFYDELSPYGTWIDYTGHGYVWQPTGLRDFRPYATNGHWVWSAEYEWIWVSDYDWGWAPFHYGRWFYDSYYGWLWVPDYDWSPAWVVWRDGGDYYGWAPLSPGIGMDYSFEMYSPPVDYWCFVIRRYIISPMLYQHCFQQRYNNNYIQRTRILRNYNRHGGHDRDIFVNGPQRRDVERYSGQRINPVIFRESPRPVRTEVRKNEVTIYRPRVNEENRNTAKPSKIIPQGNDNRNQPVKPDRPVYNPPMQPTRPIDNPPVKPTRPDDNPSTQPTRPIDNPPVKPDRPVYNPPTQPTRPIDNPPVKPTRPDDNPSTQPTRPIDNPPVKPDRPVYNPPTQPTRPIDNQPVKPDRPVYNPPTQPTRPIDNPPVKPNRPVYNPPTQPTRPIDNPPVKPNRPVHNPPTQPTRPIDNRPIKTERDKIQPKKDG